MASSKSRKIILGIVTIWPLAYIILFMTLMLATDISANTILPLHIFTMLIVVILYIFYIKHVMYNNNLKNMREAWIILILFGGYIACIVYWYLYIWREREKVSVSPETKVSS